ncbi:hypothetical protein BUALT_Bualt17G0087100 [Buddleja alternifolia]|uniref:ubiquitinyl hydrolase 1 n=1 Tax=Buddleja alternifolia TaxID=168488 RepID=A0AAV6W507_9LAMI|nr:hypothetical protein BUALT_Bualt17G0087100 [Buddleja alternifolia]
MLEPRETDIPALFLVFIVFPLVSYFILGKWSETAKRKERISVIATRAAEEALQVNDMAVGSSVIPVVHLPNNVSRQCAKCFGPAKTRCSQCKSIWYCSGRCQIIHWRQIHKLECQQLGSSGRVSYSETTENGLFEYNIQQPIIDKVSEEASGIGFTLPTYLRKGDIFLSEHDANIPYVPNNEDEFEIEHLNAFDNGNSCGILNSSTTPITGTYSNDIQRDLIEAEYLSCEGITCSDETKGSSERSSMKRSNKAKYILNSHGSEMHRSPKSRVKVSKETQSSDTNIKIQTADESRVALIKDNIPLQDNKLTGVMGIKKSAKLEHQQHSEDSSNRQRKIKVSVKKHIVPELQLQLHFAMIFPYEEFVKCFQLEVPNMPPKGLINCGNSCYANAVLQCLMFTKPLMIYLLRQSHSRTGCAKDWCLMCELEQLVMMPRENRGPLSPVNILMYIRSLNSQIGDGSQEDAHEFLRLLVASMQSICLEGFGGENVVDQRLQDTTFIQHAFGGCLRSKVKCLRCHHESERYENMMDLTPEIFGWVESLEDALTQFTSPEDLDGENMYRCARCATYVRAWKQLSIQEAPNILTIVLKRFQEGNYGKINKCITFPEMLDMIPFMTGTDDIPPLYMLYAFVVHLDTSNASFSGHYISYVKDLQGNWFRVDDIEVQPVELSHVMTEGAYILFYMRSYPRPARGCNRKASRRRTPGLPKHTSSKIQRSPKPQQSNKPNQNFINRDPSLDHRLETNNVDCTNDISRGVLIRENRSRPSILKNYAEFSDPTSSDWSVFTSSDDSSFTTESTRDSFSTDVPFSSIFQSLYNPAECGSHRTISCSVFPGSKPQTRFAHEEKGFVSVEPTAGVHVNCGSDPRNGQPQTYVHCNI